MHLYVGLRTVHEVFMAVQWEKAGIWPVFGIFILSSRYLLDWTRGKQFESLKCFFFLMSCGPKMGRIVLWLKAERGSDLLLLGLLGEEHSLDVGEDTTLGNGDTGEEFVEFLVVADGELEMTGDDPGLLVVTGSVAGELEDLSCEVLHDGSEVYWGTSTYTFGIVSLA